MLNTRVLHGEPCRVHPYESCPYADDHIYRAILFLLHDTYDVDPADVQDDIPDDAEARASEELYAPADDEQGAYSWTDLVQVCEQAEQGVYSCPNAFHPVHTGDEAGELLLPLYTYC